MAKRKKKSNTLTIILAVALAAALLVIFVPRVVNECEGCGETVFGTGYYKEALADALIGALSGEQEVQVDKASCLCESCAADINASIKIGLREVEEFKRPLF